MPRDLPSTASAAGVPVHEMEDGFIRSVGLGSGLHPPLSIVVDSRGIYYDPGRPSDLEALLGESDFTPGLIDRARHLIDDVVRSGISKYASGRARFEDLPAGRRSVLVAGQVEDDRSMKLGAAGVAGNLDLLRRARAAEPGAVILFKPHPDVEAGHRQGRIPDDEALRLADRIVRDVPMSALLEAVDAVHVTTSLTGFEALLRSREVFTHGQPFFAGWGLTTDLGPAITRRGRRLTLEQLVAGVLILYPRYLDPVTRLPCPPEILIARLAETSVVRSTPLTLLRRWQGRIRYALGVASQ
jgi:capsular polysaccharide export protein